MVPDDIGGRYSVQTAVGLFPIACAGIDPREILAGSAAARENCEDPSLETNQAYRYAVIRREMYAHYHKAVEMFITYVPGFVQIGEWWKQLFGESEGKDHKGLLPDSATFTTDLHSLGQFVQEGSPVFFETTLHLSHHRHDQRVLRLTPISSARFLRLIPPASYLAIAFSLIETSYVLYFSGQVFSMSLYFDYGKTPTLVSKPTRPSDATYQYDFTGWSPELVPVVGPATYTAQFKQVPLEVVTYEITDMSVRVFASSSGSVWVCTIGEVTNTGNVDLYLRSGTIDLKDDADKLLESCQYVSVYPQIISPGEKAYYQESTTVDGITAETTVNATLHTSAAKSVIAKTALPISDVSLKNVTFWGVGAIGMVTNNTANDSSSVYVVVVLYNQANHERPKVSSGWPRSGEGR